MLRWLSLGAVVLGVVSDFSFGKILKTASEMLTHYDFVVVGGGTAGNVIANRLTEDPNIRVLVIEAGGSNEGVQLLEVPFFSQDIYKTKAYFWNYTTTPQVALAGKSFFYARGHVLGGCSSTMPHSIDEIMIKATEGNSEFPFNIDYNSGRPLGFGWQQTTITSNGRRDSSATSYLGPKFIQRSNLHVLLNHRVLRLLPAGSPGAHFNAVEFVEIVDGVVGPQHVITASKEIVLSAGSVGTPAILLHSGIGDSNTLSALGIKPLHHLPSVGQNFTEQPAVAVHWLVNDTNTSEQLRNNSLAAELLDEWENNKPSLLSAPPSTHLGFLRLPDNASVFENTPDPSAGSNTPHIELFISNGALLSPLPPAGNFLGIVAIGLTPVSRKDVLHSLRFR
ncbi:hypothetical protein EYR38_009553 [Pleurotus pulmonarius]|nr:hypothetical protein EYR38_009553 [Pleurotus pulmonarius]